MVIVWRSCVFCCVVKYRDGLELFGEADEHLLPDLLHPNGEGYELMGK